MPNQAVQVKILVRSVMGGNESAECVVDGDVVNGLAVTRNPRIYPTGDGWCWAVTHAPSGYAVKQDLRLDTAHRVRAFLTDGGLDWASLPIPAPKSSAVYKRLCELNVADWFLAATECPDPDDDEDYDDVVRERDKLRAERPALLAVAEAGRRLSIAEAALQAALADNLVGYIPCEITQEARDALAGLRTALSALDGEGR